MEVDTTFPDDPTTPPPTKPANQPDNTMIDANEKLDNEKNYLALDVFARQCLDLARIVWASKHQTSKENIMKSFKLLSKITSNLEKHFNDNEADAQRFKKLRCQNKTIKKQFLEVNGMELWLNCFSFYRKMIPLEDQAFVKKSSDGRIIRPKELAFVYESISTLDAARLRFFKLPEIQKILSEPSTYPSNNRIKFIFSSTFSIFPNHQNSVVAVFTGEETIEDLYQFVRNIVPEKYSALSASILIKVYEPVTKSHQTMIKSEMTLKEQNEKKGIKLFGSSVRVVTSSEDVISWDEQQRITRAEAQLKEKIRIAEISERTKQRWREKEMEKQAQRKERVDALLSFE